MNLAEDITKFLPEIEALRHELHAHPEIRFQEQWTSDRIVQFLEENGIPFERGLAGGTGIVATVTGNGKKTVALRADIDALEIEEATGLPYASTIPERMHACGHDGHMACLCGAIKVIKAHQHALKGTVKFLFQPAEEVESGARLMVADGAADGVDAIFGLHGWPSLPVGSIAVNPGPFMAGADFFQIEVQGQGCHGAKPEAGVDPIVAAAQIITALQGIVSRELDPNEAGVVTVASIHAGEGSNIIPDTAVMKGTLRAFSEAGLDTLRNSLTRIAEQTAAALRAKAVVTFPNQPYPPLSNDTDCAAFVRDVAQELLGEDAVTTPETPSMGAEDFAHYLKRVPGAFFFLGVNPEPATPYPQLHNPMYNFPDAALPYGIELLSTLALRYLAD